MTTFHGDLSIGDIFNLTIYRPWEFDATSPIRSVVPLYLMYGLPLALLRLSAKVGAITTVTGYMVLIVSRLAVVIASFGVDLCVYRMSAAARLSSRYGSALLVASSYVTLVYYSRTFSNTLEAFLFALLLYQTMQYSDKLSDQDKTKHTMSESGCKDLCPDDKPFQRSDSFAVALTIVTGVFNRPTFVFYALIPYLCWLQTDQIFGQFSEMTAVLRRAVKSGVSVMFISLLFIFGDSLYHGRMSLERGALIGDLREKGILEFVTTNLTVTPYNFAAYNLQPKNLAEHGVHLRITHVAVNVQLLFGFLGAFAVVDVGHAIVRRSFPKHPSSTALLASYTVPLLLLSVFPHQEPRFLIPLLIPLTIVYSSRLCGPDSCRVWRWAWIVFNVLGCVFFGIFHQGGVVSAIASFQPDIIISRSVTEVNFWHTYMPPRHLFMISSADDNVQPSIVVNDLAGSTIDKLFLSLEASRQYREEQATDVFLVVPGSLHYHLICALQSHPVFTLELWHVFSPHFSGEDPPDLGIVTGRSLDFKDCHSYIDDLRAKSVMRRLFDSMSLNVYKVASSLD